MNRFLTIAVATALLSGCALYDRLDRPNYDNPFYAKYLNTGSELDGRINETLNALRQNPNSPSLHNELGMLLVQKGFPKDAERGFEQAINLDRKYHEAWYNLGLVRASRGDEGGARRAYMATIDHKPGHAQALFQLGLIEEKLQHTSRAIELYAKAIRINPKLLDVAVNPRILDTELIHLALLRNYQTAHDRESMQFQGVGARRTTPPQAPSAQPTPQQIIPPSAPATDPSQQTPPARPPV